jgi:hypothetical protein
MPVIIPATSPAALGQTIAGILTALIDAQAQSARTTIDFVNQVGFTQDPVDNTDKLRSVQFKYQKLDENNQRTEFIVELPMLGLVEIPLLAIKTAKIEFEFDVTSTQTTSSAQVTAGPGPARSSLLGITREKTILKGVLPPKASGNGTSKAALKIVIEIEKSPLPVSLDRTLNILEVAYTETKKP